MVMTAERPETSLETIKTGPIAELPAVAAWLAACFTDGPRQSLSSVRISPLGEDQVLVESMSTVTVCTLRCNGSAQRPLWLPGRLLSVLRGKHGEGHLLSIRQLDGPLISIRSYAPDSTLAWSLPEPGPAFDRTPVLPGAQEVSTPVPVRFDPILLRSVFAQIAAFGGIAVSLLQESWGLRLKLTGEDLEGELLILGLQGDRRGG